MNAIIFPLLASLIGSADVVFEKYIFDRKRSKYKIFVPFLFGSAFLFLIIFFYPFLGSIDKKALAPLLLFFMFLVVAFGLVRNMLYYNAFQKEGLCKIEPFMAFLPLLTIIIAGVIYPDERNALHLVLALVAGMALVFSQVEKKHLVVDKSMLPIIGVVFLEAIENNLVKELLYFYSPVAMYTVRAGLIALVLVLFTKPKFKSMNKKEVKNLTLVSFFWVLTMIFAYYGYQTVGVVYTSLILMLSPVLIVIGSWLILKEKKIRKRNIIALAVVVICVALAQILS